MKFYSDIPNLHIIREKKLGNRSEPHLLCKFDENGELESEDKEVIRQLINIYRHDEIKQSEANKTDEEIRLLAKAKGIKNWHNKKIENLLTELKEVTP